MSDAFKGLLDLLDLETIEVDLYRGRSPETEHQRVFGGQVAGQALVAAVRTVDPERSVHSLHAYFLRPGDPSVPILYEVDRIRDGRSFTTRRVEARQHGKAIFHLSASFQRHEDGLEHADAMPEVPAPDDVLSIKEQAAQEGVAWEEPFPEWRAIDLRYVDSPSAVAAAGDDRLRMWMRITEPLPADRLLHTCLLTYLSDISLLYAAVLPHGIGMRSGVLQMASLDHAMWFHRPFRVDGWLLYDQRSPSASGGRGLAMGRVFDRDGALVASVVQEGLIRPRRDRPDR